MEKGWKRIETISDDNENIYNIYKTKDGTFVVTNDTVVEYMINDKYYLSENEAYNAAYKALDKVGEE